MGSVRSGGANLAPGGRWVRWIYQQSIKTDTSAQPSSEQRWLPLSLLLLLAGNLPQQRRCSWLGRRVASA
jgi:hypothetical protein